MRRPYPDGTITTAGYDPAGNLTAWTDELGRTTTTFFDCAEPLRSRRSAPTGRRCKRRPVRRRGQNRRRDRFRRQRHDLAYDAVGRVREERRSPRPYSDPDLRRRRATCTSFTDSLGRTTQYAYDARSRPATDPLGHSTTIGYDADGNLSVTDPLSRTTPYGYDRTRPGDAITDPLGHHARQSSTCHDVDWGNSSVDTDLGTR